MDKNIVSILTYSDILLLSFLICTYIIVSIAINRPSGLKKSSFIVYSSFTIAFCLLDAFMSFYDNQMLPFTIPRWLYYLCDILYNLLAIGAGACIWAYARAQNDNQSVLLKVFSYIAYGIIGSLALVSIFAYRTDWFVSVTPEGLYTYGKLDILWYIVTYVFLLMIVGFEINFYLNKKYYAYRDHHLSILMGMVIIFVFSSLQLIVPTMIFASIGFLLCNLFLYIRIMASGVSVDELTRVNNRKALVRELNSRLFSPKLSKKWALIILDADNFKEINDNYGHVEGDKAIVKLCSIIQKGTEKYNSKIYRYGGDEFIVLKEFETANHDQEIKDLLTFINHEFDKYNSYGNERYNLMVSYGTAIYDAETDKNIPDVINRADKLMYEMKKEHKAK